jgi:hypothetical protein
MLRLVNASLTPPEDSVRNLGALKTCSVPSMGVLCVQGMTSTRDFLAQREAELAQQLDDLRKKREPLENELADVRRARAALGPEPPTLLDVARRVATGPPSSNFADWTLKQMTIRALQDHFPEGATALTLLEFFRTAYGREIARESLSPQLSRLADKDRLLSRDGRVWKLSPHARQAMGLQN